jgi:hypothetical protein
MSINDPRGNSEGSAHTDDHASVGIGIFFQEDLDNGKSLVMFVRDGEDDLEVGVFLVEGRL